MSRRLGVFCAVVLLDGSGSRIRFVFWRTHWRSTFRDEAPLDPTPTVDSTFSARAFH